jgi:hypothetical protein
MRSVNGQERVFAKRASAQLHQTGKARAEPGHQADAMLTWFLAGRLQRLCLYDAQVPVRMPSHRSDAIEPQATPEPRTSPLPLA